MTEKELLERIAHATAAENFYAEQVKIAERAMKKANKRWAAFLVGSSLFTLGWGYWIGGLEGALYITGGYLWTVAVYCKGSTEGMKIQKQVMEEQDALAEEWDV